MRERAKELVKLLLSALGDARTAPEQTKVEIQEVSFENYDQHYGRRPTQQRVVVEGRDVLLGRAITLAEQIEKELAD